MDDKDYMSVYKTYEKPRSLKAYFVDTSARILFYVPIIGVWEKFVADMENAEVFKSRVTATLVNLFIGRLHGKVREFVSYLTHTTDESSEKRKTVADTVAGLIVGGTSYAGVLYVSGVSWEEALTAMPFALIFTTTTGRPYGKFHDWYRKKFGTTPVYEK